MGLFDKIFGRKKDKLQENSNFNNFSNASKNYSSEVQFTIKSDFIYETVNGKIPINESDKAIFEKIKQNEEIAHKFRYGDEKERDYAIKIYEANIAYGIYCDSYSELFLLYEQKREYDKAIDIIKKEMDFFIKEYGEAPERLKNNLKMVENQRLINIFAENNKKGMKLEEEGKIDDAIKAYKENIDLNADTPYSYSALARLYHYKKEFQLEKEVLMLAVKKFKSDSHVNGGYKNGFEEQLENVESYLNVGRFKRDCLPSDPKNIYYKIKKAKETLQENEEEGCKQLEMIIDDGTYNNTAYFTLYKVYKKNEQYDDAIRVCKKAIEVLGLFSQDRIDKYTKYMEKIPTFKPDIKPEKDKNSKATKSKKSNSKIKNTDFKPTTKYCVKCLTEMDLNCNVCPNCNYDFINNYYSFEDKSFLNNSSFSNLSQKELTIKNIDVPQLSTSKKAKFNYNSKELFVEEVVMEFYKQRGYSAIWSENDYWNMIYALLFWDVIFMPTDTCVQVPMNHKDFSMQYDFFINSEMMDMPQDFFKDSFYLQRKEAIDKRIKELLNQDISQLIRESYYEHYGKRCRAIYDWDKYSIEKLSIPLKSLKNEQIVLIMDRMLHDFAYCRSGLPDVIIFNDNEFIFVEAKSKNDAVSDSQAEWHKYLLNIVKVKVILFTLNKTERQMKNISKKYETFSKKSYTKTLSFDLNNYSLDDMDNLNEDELLIKQKNNEKFAKELEEIGKINDAIKLYEANVNSNAPFKESYNKVANFYAEKREYDEAIMICKSGISNINSIKDQNFLRRRIAIFENNKSLYKMNSQPIKKEVNLTKPQFDIYCIHCGEGLTKDSNFCHNCGKKVEK